MPITLKDYGRNWKERKEYIHQSGLLISEVDDSKAKNNACSNYSAKKAQK